MDRVHCQVHFRRPVEKWSTHSCLLPKDFRDASLPSSATFEELRCPSTAQGRASSSADLRVPRAASASPLHCGPCLWRFVRWQILLEFCVVAKEAFDRWIAQACSLSLL